MGAIHALQSAVASVASFGAAQLAPFATRLLTRVPVDVSDVQVFYKASNWSGWSPSSNSVPAPGSN